LVVLLWNWLFPEVRRAQKLVEERPADQGR
jgi:hypothetical protein